MRFKTDENVPTVVAVRLGGARCHRVDEQGLNGVADPQVAAAWVAEDRVIVTLDLDFSDVRSFPPENYPGIIVLRPSSQLIPVLERLIDLVIALLDQQPLVGQLWIVEDSRIRVRAGSGTP